MPHGSDWLADLVERDAQREARAARLADTLRHEMPSRPWSTSQNDNGRTIGSPVRARRHTHPERTARPAADPDNMR